jgi:sialate O-acetylesterase
MNGNGSLTNSLVCLTLLICLLHWGTVQAEPFQMQLDDHWVIKTGDDPAWSAMDLDNSTWKAIQTGVPWEEAGLADYDGYAWYRLEFVIPNTSRDQIEQHAKDNPFGPYLILSMGAVDDVDETFFNGKMIGSTGSMLPYYSTAYDVPRKYRIPISAIKWDQTNVLAVRVFDGLRCSPQISDSDRRDQMGPDQCPCCPGF